MSTLVQLDTAKWQRGLEKPVAVLRFEPSDLESRLGVRFDEQIDDFDGYRAALLKTLDNRPFALVRYLNNPKKGTEIWVMSNSEDLRSELSSVLRALQVDSNDLLWTHRAAKLTNSEVRRIRPREASVVAGYGLLVTNRPRRRTSQTERIPLKSRPSSDASKKGKNRRTGAKKK